MPRAVFLAAPETGAGAIGLIDKLLVELEIATGGALKASNVFVPHLQIGDVGIDTDAETYFTRTLTALQEARVIVAILDGTQTDEQVSFLIGYAFAAEKPIIGYLTDRRAKSPLVASTLTSIAHDLRGLSAALAAVLTA